MKSLENELKSEHNPESTCPAGMPYKMCGNRGYRCGDCGINPKKVVYHNTIYDRNVAEALFEHAMACIKKI